MMTPATSDAPSVTETFSRPQDRSIVQAEEFGVSVSNVVRTQAAEMRMKRRYRAEAKALQVPVKMLFPLLVCLLPVLFIVVLAPAAMNIADTFSKG